MKKIMVFPESFNEKNSQTTNVESQILDTYKKDNPELQSAVDLIVEYKNREKEAYFVDEQNQRMQLKVEHSKMVLENFIPLVEGKEIGELFAQKDQLLASIDEHALTFALQHLLRANGANVEVDGVYGPATEAAVNGLPVQGDKFFYNTKYPSIEVARYLIDNADLKTVQVVAVDTLEKESVDNENNNQTPKTTSDASHETVTTSQKVEENSDTQKQVEQVPENEFTQEKHSVETLVAKEKLTKEEIATIRSFVVTYAPEHASQVRWITTFIEFEKDGLLSQQNKIDLQKMIDDAKVENAKKVVTSFSPNRTSKQAQGTTVVSVKPDHVGEDKNNQTNAQKPKSQKHTAETTNDTIETSEEEIVALNPELAFLGTLGIQDLGRFEGKDYVFKNDDATQEITIEGKKFEKVTAYGNFSGLGFRESNNGTLYVGEFKNNKYEGTGVRFHSDGTINYGVWKEGKFYGKEAVQVVDTQKLKVSDTPTPVVTEKPEQVPAPTTPDLKNEQQETAETLKYSIEMQKSEALIGKHEMQYFLQFFEINSVEDYNTVVDKLQTTLSSKDRIIGPQTLEYIYLNNYAPVKDSLPAPMQTRLEAHKVLADYAHKNTKNLPLTGLKSAFDREYFYGYDSTKNIENSFINEELAGVPKTDIYNNGYSLQIKKINGKTATLMYAEGKLVVATFNSPGTEENPTPQNSEYKVGDMYENYISNSYPKRTSGKDGGAVMPYAYRINGGYFGHVGRTDGNYASHGCLRAPLLYQAEIFKQLEHHGREKFTIKIDDIY